MRIAIVTTSYPSRAGDPAGHFVQTEAFRLADAGHQVMVLSPGSRAPLPGNPQVLGLGGGAAFGWPGFSARVRQRPWRLLSVLPFLVSVTRTLRRAEIDRVVAHWIIPCAWPVALFIRTPIQVVAHGSDVRLLQRLPGAIRRGIVNSLLRAGAEFRFVSASLRKDLIGATTERLRERSTVLPSPIDVPANLSRTLARKLLEVSESERLVVMIGRLVASKRFAVALSAATLLPNTRVVVVGGGPERMALESTFPTAHFLGTLPRNQALLWLSAADVLISSSLEEGAPTVVREARALNVEVVAVECADLAAWAAGDAGIHLVKPKACSRKPAQTKLW